MKPLIHAALVFLLLLAPFSARALTLAEAIDRAERTYPSQLAAEEAIREARLQLKGVYWGLTPAALVNVVDQRSATTSDPVLPPGSFPPMTRSFTVGAAFSISNIWKSWFMARLAKANINLQEALAAVSGNALALTVTQAYASFVAANSQLNDCAEFKSAVASLAEAANNGAITAGVGAIVTQLESIEAAIRVQRLRASDTLMSLISQDAGDIRKRREVQPFSDEIPELLKDMPSKLEAVTEALPLLAPDDAIKRALTRAPMLLAAGYSAEVAEKSRTFGWVSTILPDFSVNVTKSRVDTSVAGYPLQQRANGVLFNITWTWGGKSVVDDQVAGSKAGQARLRLRATEIEIENSVRGAYRTFQSLGPDILKQQSSFNKVKAQFEASKTQLALLRSIGDRLKASPDLQSQARALTPFQNQEELAKFTAAAAEAAPELSEDLAKLAAIGDLNQLSQLIATGLENWAKLYEEALGFVATAAQIHMYTGDLIRLNQLPRPGGRNPASVDVGAGGGVNGAVIAPSDSAVDASTTANFSAGVLADFPIRGSVSFSFEAGAFFERNLFTVEGTESLVYRMMFPLLARWHAAPFFSLGAGWYAGGNLNTEDGTYYEPFDTGLATSIAFDIPVAPRTKFFLDGRWYLGVLHQNNAGDTYRSIQGLAGLKFAVN